MKQLKLRINGMSCAACSSGIERSLRRKSFIKSIDVDLISESAIIIYDENATSKEDIIKLIERLNYTADEFSTKVEKKQKDNNYIIAIIFAIPLLIISMGGMLFFKEQMQEYANIICLLEIILLLPILYAARNIYINGIKALLHFVPNMDSLVSLGSLSAIVYSLYMIDFSNSTMLHNLYFESAGVILAVIMLGKKLESIATNNAKNGIESLNTIIPKTALKANGDTTIETKIEFINKGEIIVIPKGAMFSLDSTLLEDECYVDESIITGESKPKLKKYGELIYSGSINQGEQTKAMVVARAEDSMIGKILLLMQDIKKAPIARIADSVSAYFVPSVITLAIIASLTWLYISGDFHKAFIVFTSTLLISCPCALGLATPLSILIATYIASKRGFYYKNAKSLEIASKLKYIVFDKTGTLTKGKLEVLESHLESSLDSNGNSINIIESKDYIFSLIYALEQKSEHIIAKAILKHIKSYDKKLEASNIKTMPGLGISGIVDNKLVKIGNAKFIANSKEINLPHTICHFSIDEKYLGYFVIIDELRDNAKVLIDNLSSLNIKSIILSGDNKQSVESVARLCDITEFYHSALPQDKLNFIENLQKNGELVGFIGDGINDALALSKADIGISLAYGSDIAIKQADIILLNGDLNTLYKALKLSKQTIRNIKQNLSFAFVYNVAAIPLAIGIPQAFGLHIMLNPMIAGTAMGLSSLSVVLNAMRLYKYKARI